MVSRSARRGVVAVIAAVALLLPDRVPSPQPGSHNGGSPIAGPYAALLADSADLGATRADSARLTAELASANRPSALMRWAARHGLSVRWRPGDTWASLQGPPANAAAAFDVAIHDYRNRRGTVFYAAAHQPLVPAELRPEVSAFGRLLGYTPSRDAHIWDFPRGVGSSGVAPSSLVRTYNADPLAQAGFTGKGITVVVFAFDGFDQPDLDLFADTYGLPRFVPDVVGGMASRRSGEATMDLETIHAIAPDAKKVLVNARSTVEGDGGYEKIALMMEDAQRRYPGAVWSFSIGWGCDKLITAADLVPVRSALQAAHRNGTTAFNASGDLAGLECKGGENWSAPPSPDDTGLDAIASLPEMTDVGGTTLSVDAEGGWVAEQSWFNPAVSLGTGGGVSALFERPTWQDWLPATRGSGKRIVPDVAGVADPASGVRIVFQQQVLVGGGTSMAAPVWAGLTAIMNQYLLDNGGRLIGDLNPLLYETAQGARRPGFRDVTLGGNAVDDAAPGFDLVSGLGTPDIANLAGNLLAVQRSWIGVR